MDMFKRGPAWLWLLLASLVLTAAMLAPFSFGPEGVALDSGDSLHQAWTIHWIQSALSSAGPPLFNAPTNYPYPTSLAINQPIYTSALLGLPLYWAGLSPIGVFNVLVIMS